LTISKVKSVAKEKKGKEKEKKGKVKKAGSNTKTRYSMKVIQK